MGTTKAGRQATKNRTAEPKSSRRRQSGIGNGDDDSTLELLDSTLRGANSRAEYQRTAATVSSSSCLFYIISILPSIWYHRKFTTNRRRRCRIFPIYTIYSANVTLPLRSFYTSAHLTNADNAKKKKKKQ